MKENDARIAGRLTTDSAVPNTYGRFYRMIPLPQGAETDPAKAEFKDGLLQVHVPVPESQRQSRQIPIAS